MKRIKKRGRRLRTALDCRIFLSRIITELYNQEIQPDIARACIYGLSVALRSIELSDIENRISKLEELMYD
jgi:hypothetical protein